MVLRLDPAIPIVWRDPRTVQLGVDPVVAVIPEVVDGAERLLAVLAAGVSESGYPMLAGTFGVTATRAAALLAAVAPGLLAEAGDEPPPPRGVVVLGDGPLALGVSRVLTDARLRAGPRRRPALAMLVADRILAPAEYRGWLQRDIPHLPVIVTDSAVTVGPLVVPGRTACLHCRELHRRDVDPAWPAIAAQLMTLPPPAAHPLRTASAIALAARVAAHHLAGAAPVPELRITGDGDELSERRVAPHPDCRCAARQESDWAPVDAPAAPRSTMTATASAGHA